MKWLKDFWDSLDIVKILALIVAVSYVVFLAIKVPADETLKNVFLLVMGFYFGSSNGSKAKEAAMLASPPIKPAGQ